MRSIEEIADEFIDLWGFVQCLGVPYGPSATSIGFHDFDDHLFVPSKSNVQKARNGFEKLRHELESVDHSQLGFLERLRANELLKNVRSFEMELNWSLQSPIFYLRHLAECVVSLANCEYLPKEERGRNIIKRLRHAENLLEESKRLVKNTSKRHVKLAEQLGRELQTFFTEALVAFARNLQGEVKRNLFKEGKKAAEEIGRYLRYLRSIYSTLPDAIHLSREEYERVLQRKFGLDIGIEDLKQLGESQFEKWENELQKISKKIVPKVDTWKAVKKELMKDYPKTDREVIEQYTSTASRIREFLHQTNVLTMPKGEELRVRETPEWDRMFKGTASCWCDDIAGGKPTSTLWITPSIPHEESLAHRKEHYKAHQAPLLAHECYPGHHIHYSSMAVHAPRSRKIYSSLWTPVVEGWAMYSNVILDENGFYDAREKFAMAELVLWRAVRVIVDIALHTGEMSYEEAVSFLMEKLAMSRSNATSEVNAHLLHPGTKAKYLWGRTRILRLRETVKEIMGDQYDARWFHDSIIQEGFISMTGLEELIIHKANRIKLKKSK